MGRKAVMAVKGGYCDEVRLFIGRGGRVCAQEMNRNKRHAPE